MKLKSFGLYSFSVMLLLSMALPLAIAKFSEPQKSPQPQPVPFNPCANLYNPFVLGSGKYYTKPAFFSHVNSPSGMSSTGNDRVIFKFKINACGNAQTNTEEMLVVKHVNLSMNRDGVAVSNVKLYPEAHDNDNGYASTCIAKGTQWNCELNTAGATNEIMEGTTATYVVHADVSVVGQNLINTLTPSIKFFCMHGTTVGDVVWNDKHNPDVCLDQPIVKSAAPLTYSL